ncbi:hypothetical protein K2173_016471 [Erythroxylum novogranatense]|uniref:DUF4283 domain-containing protein n=1 Tax=Erythroxylum novogranatense TaxID=1862640 RepID=A0AAV8SH76_9ROSI|nr:hypothetical protein K2173_016471 [Erythroxylum novogranatense]
MEMLGGMGEDGDVGKVGGTSVVGKGNDDGAVLAPTIEDTTEASGTWLEDEPITIEADDIRLISSELGGGILLSQQLKSKPDQQWSHTVVVKLLGRRVGYRVLSTRLRSLWQPKGPLKIVDMDHDVFLVKFLEEEDFLHRWFPSFRAAGAQLTRAVVWLRILDMPIAQYHPQILKPLGNTMDSTIKLDEATLHAQRGKYARLAVEIDLSLPLPSSMILDGETLLIAYKGLPPICPLYGMIGHERSCCPQNHQASTDPQPPLAGDSDGAAHMWRRPGEIEVHQQEGTYTGQGAWTRVQRKTP